MDFGDLQTRDQLNLYVQQNVRNDESDPIRGVTFLSEDRAPVSVFTEFALPEFAVDVEQKDEFVQLEVTRRIESSTYEDGYKQWETTVYVISHTQKSVYTAFTISDNEIYKKCLNSYISLLPFLSQSYLTTSELRGVFDVLDEETNGDIIVEEAVIKSPNSKTDILYLKERYFNLFNTKKVAEGDYYVDKVKFSISGRSQFSGFLSRHGENRYSRGSSNIYFDYLLDIAGEALVKKGSIFENKSREYGSREAERIKISYEPGTIRGTEDNLELIDALQGMNASSVTVYHKNPYMHASVHDFEDGTTADVFISSDESISIIPGFKASKGSLSRICENITSRFREGEVSEDISSGAEFDDFFSG